MSLSAVGSPIQVPQTPSAFPPRAQRTGFRRCDVRQQSRLFVIRVCDHAGNVIENARARGRFQRAEELLVTARHEPEAEPGVDKFGCAWTLCSTRSGYGWPQRFAYSPHATMFLIILSRTKTACLTFCAICWTPKDLTVRATLFLRVLIATLPDQSFPRGIVLCFSGERHIRIERHLRRIDILVDFEDFGLAIRKQSVDRRSDRPNQ